ncbi:hypothetical protein [Streptomyces chiangmaiensis]|uniref:Uncharacterized protein n=1 Tax=Streptomyces chiangmaiensis TaxID=766497 RepID=A0ABU7FVU2_9ACTN|nr:hypothetical protein [Streptomyces chiangmaiensis]MED7828061.1 hypothetical protein [Streptomyces chiangmaiensis]
MSAGWVATVVRARALTNRCPGPAGAREMASAVTLEDAPHRLAGTPYRKYARTAVELPEAQRAVSATLLWHLRVLAGWLPPGGARLLRPLAAACEVANVASRLTTQNRPGADPDAPARQPYRLGALETAWRSLDRARTPAELRAALAASAWGDPGADTPWALVLGMRMAAARRTAMAVPSARRWARGRAALLTAREMFVHERRLPGPVRRDAAELLGSRAVDAPSFRDFRDRLSSEACWVVADVEEPGELWRAEARWWRVVDREGVDMLRGGRYGPREVVGAVAVLSVDAWRVRAALEPAARAGRPLEEFDALV